MVLNQINTIIKGWYRNVVYVFITIILTLLLATTPETFNVIRKKGSIGYNGLLQVWLEELPNIIMPISFVLIGTFLCLLVYTSYIIIRIVVFNLKSPFNSNWVKFYYFVLILSSCVFVALISLIGIHCLQLDYKIRVLYNIFGNFIGCVMLIFLIIKQKVFRWKKWVIFGLATALLVLNAYWIGPIIKPAIEYFLDRKYQTLSKILRYSWIIFILGSMWALNRISLFSEDNQKRFSLTFSILALVYWSFSWLEYEWYMDIVNSLGNSQYIFMLLPILASLAFALIYLTIQVISLNRNKSRFIKTKIFLSFIGICYVCLAAYTVSLMRNPVHQKLFLDFLSGHVQYRLLDLARMVLDAEGLDLLFCFALALISGYIVYSKKTKFDIKGFFVALLAWAIVLSGKEIIKCYLPLRDADVLDVTKNMIGGVLPGLVLSSRWFWKK